MKRKEIEGDGKGRSPSRKERRQLQRKLVKAKRNAWQHGHKIPMSIDTLRQSTDESESKRKKKKKKQKTKKDEDEELSFDEEAAEENHRKILLEDNQLEDANIKKLEKLLGIKSSRKTYLQGFVNDGLDYILDFCDGEKRKEILRAETDGWDEQFDEDYLLNDDEKWLREKQKKKIELANRKDKGEEKEKTKKKPSVVKFNDEIETKLIDEEEEEEEETPKLREDIYGRTIDAKGNLVKTTTGGGAGALYVPPALRQKNSSSELRRRLQGQLNRLSEKNLPSILKEIEGIYREESRGEVNRCLLDLCKDLLLSPISVSGESLMAEHALLLSLLHTNLGLEIGSFLLENLLPIFVEHFHDDVPNKTNDNLIQLLSYLYAFHLTNNKLIFDVAKELLNRDEHFPEKRLELILALLRTVGFLLRKENPLELKTLLQQVRTKASTNISASSTRFRYLIETISSLKNNDVRKLPGSVDPDRVDRLRKIGRTLIRDKTAQQTQMLNVGLDDFLQAHERGRWWIVGSAWQKHSSTNGKPTNTFDEQFDAKIRKLAKEQHMNTDIRRLVFGTLLTSEDCGDAVEKLHRLNLNKVQEREIIHVTVHCALNEKNYNPYYTLILQRFCSFDRRFQMSLQYHTWDRFKELASLNEQQLTNFGSTLRQLLLSQSISLNIFKNFNFVELTSSARTFLVDLFVQFFADVDERSLREIFDLPNKSNRKFLREALRLFLSHFILNKNKSSELVRRRCQLMYEDYFSIDDILSTQERFRCQLLVDIPKLGFLESSSSSASTLNNRNEPTDPSEENGTSSLSANSKLELPYWMIYSICNCKTRFASLPELPQIYSRIQRQIFAADASVVDLAKQAPHFYRQGRHLLQLNFDEKRQVALTLLQTYQQRFRSIMDAAFHLILSADHHHHESMKQQTGKFERQEKLLLLLGQAAFRDFDRLINNETKQILPTNLSSLSNDLTNIITTENYRKRKR